MSRPFPVTRRALLALATLPLGACVAGSGTPAPAVARFRTVRVDTGPLAARGVGRYAGVVAETLRAAVAQVFAGRLAPNDRGAPTLTIEVATVRLAAWSGSGAASGFGFEDGGDSDDTMTGALVLTSTDGRAIDRRSHMATSDAGSGGPWYLPESEQRRLAALCRNYAGWALREYGG